MKFRNFSAKSGSSLAAVASLRSRAICTASRAGSAGGRLWVALYSPTAWVHLKRSASMWISAASILSMLSRRRSSSGWLMVRLCTIGGQNLFKRKRAATPAKFPHRLRPGFIYRQGERRRQTPFPAGPARWLALRVTGGGPKRRATSGDGLGAMRNFRVIGLLAFALVVGGCAGPEAVETPDATQIRDPVEGMNRFFFDLN